MRAPAPNGDANHLVEILVSLADAEIEFIICGGVAAILHGVERMTLDIDLSVNLVGNNAAMLANTMQSLGLQPRVPVDPRTLGDPDAVRAMVEEKGAIVFTFSDPERPFRHVDVFLTQKLSYTALLGETQMFNMYGREFRVLTARKLLSLKEAISPPRPKDSMDILALRQIVAAKGAHQ
jgi:hypothetical protein